MRIAPVKHRWRASTPKFNLQDLQQLLALLPALSRLELEHLVCSETGTFHQPFEHSCLQELSLFGIRSSDPAASVYSPIHLRAHWRCVDVSACGSTASNILESLPGFLSADRMCVRNRTSGTHALLPVHVGSCDLKVNHLEEHHVDLDHLPYVYNRICASSAHLQSLSMSLSCFGLGKATRRP